MLWLTDWSLVCMMKYADCVHDGSPPICHTTVDVSLNKPIAGLATSDRKRLHTPTLDTQYQQTALFLSQSTANNQSISPAVLAFYTSLNISLARKLIYLIEKV